MSDNRIERVAIAGASGNLGRILTEEVVKTGKHMATALDKLLAAAAAKAGVPHVMLNFYGSDVYNDTYRANTLNSDASLYILRHIHDTYPAITTMS
ncbi:hypothetical protein B0T24DRAFT_682062 [Lasiosphaeria ovina]|uniref:Uncharacterized protein n=1 Tax=Lasiosphaeria ovina TaxID=92902 RepID=A0AAE0JZJ4_9PEZI|nr:hypothetical protein B0T24DRAFT_682062 [Lasiosphaeria ovina]